ncbi:hypothetical protein [Streptomyces sp. Tu 2975]|uniref:hypothetical protein n=1 Tax=Streptomyces sp. Tu 2975 TaxID=2676871 RepID=UPI00244C8D47|nr:hypothetical protein [Streptomyces sp. Tu 2975]
MYAMRRALSAGAAAVLLLIGAGAASAGVDGGGSDGGGVDVGGVDGGKVAGIDGDGGGGGGGGVDGGGVGGGKVAGIAPEADVAHHGRVSLTEGRIVISVTTLNHGPSALAGVTVRLTLSVPPAGTPRLPHGCLRAAERELLCATGALALDGLGRTLGLELGTVGSPHEVVVHVATAWNGGASDRNPMNDEHRVLVPATGDPYVF